MIALQNEKIYISASKGSLSVPYATPIFAGFPKVVSLEFVLHVPAHIYEYAFAFLPSKKRVKIYQYQRAQISRQIQIVHIILNRATKKFSFRINLRPTTEKATISTIFHFSFSSRFSRLSTRIENFQIDLAQDLEKYTYYILHSFSFNNFPGSKHNYSGNSHKT